MVYSHPGLTLYIIFTFHYIQHTPTEKKTYFTAGGLSRQNCVGSKRNLRCGHGDMAMAIRYRWLWHFGIIHSNKNVFIRCFLVFITGKIDVS